MPASGSHRSIASRRNCGWRRLPGAVRTSTRRSTPAPSSRATSSSAVAVPCPTLSRRGATTLPDQLAGEDDGVVAEREGHQQRVDAVQDAAVAEQQGAADLGAEGGADE